jgi:trans-AT polyketide synthase/acyltransferase/oxidoreductase domain-containing protein
MTINFINLGNSEFKKDYGLKYAYLAGAMYKGIASVDLVIKLGQAGLMGYFGTGGLSLARIEEAIQSIQRQLTGNKAYGMNLLCNIVKPELELDTVNLFLKYSITNVEASAFMQITPSLVWFRLKGLKRKADGKIEIAHKILAKISRPEVATAFMSPAPQDIVQQLVQEGKLTTEEAECGQHIPMSNDICVEADSGGHTDQGIALTLIPTIQRLRDEMQAKYCYFRNIRVGAAGGIGTPEAAAAVFILGADFVMTGSINQCTVEAGTSESVKDILQSINVQDTTYAPAGDMFELGARVQVVRRGLLFPSRANRLYELYRQYTALNDIDEKTKAQIQEKYFKRSFEAVWEETKAYYLKEKPDEVEKAEKVPRHKMALIFKWYFVYTNRLAMRGQEEGVIDYQIHCGPAMGAFNQWVKGTMLEAWRNRHVDEIAEKLMQETAQLLTKRYQTWGAQTAALSPATSYVAEAY